MSSPNSRVQLPDTVVERAARLSTATVHEAGGKIGALPRLLKPLAATVRLCGRAFLVLAPPGDNLWLHRAIYAAKAGDVLVVNTAGGIEFGYWGEVMALAAQLRRIAGLVITGGVRDSMRTLEMDFPVFSAAVCIRGTGKDPVGAGRLAEAITIGAVTVHRGDLILGDADGVVVVPHGKVEAVVAKSERRDANEQIIFQLLRDGQSTIEIYDGPRQKYEGK